MKRQLLVGVGAAGVVLIVAVGFLQVEVMRMRSMGKPQFMSDMRSLTSAQYAYSSLNGSFYEGRLECLVEPGKCLPDYAPNGTRFLDQATASLAEQDGYSRRFCPGPAASAEEIVAAKASTSSVKTWALVSFRPASDGRPARAHCVDHTGLIRRSDVPEPPEIEDGACPQDWPAF